MNSEFDDITKQKLNEAPTVQHAHDTARKSRVPQLLRELLFIAAVIALYLVLSIFVLPRFGFQT